MKQLNAQDFTAAFVKALCPEAKQFEPDDELTVHMTIASDPTSSGIEAALTELSNAMNIATLVGAYSMDVFQMETPKWWTVFALTLAKQTQVGKDWVVAKAKPNGGYELQTTDPELFALMKYFRPQLADYLIEQVQVRVDRTETTLVILPVPAPPPTQNTRA